MNKVCATCGRENASDAFHCYACRSRDFGANSPTEDYRATQQRLAAKRQEELLQEAIESHTSLPGTHHKALLWLGAICGALVGFLAWPGAYARLVLAIGVLLFGWLVVLSRVESYRKDLERRLRKSQQYSRETSR